MGAIMPPTSFRNHGPQLSSCSGNESWNLLFVHPLLNSDMKPLEVRNARVMGVGSGDPPVAAGVLAQGQNLRNPCHLCVFLLLTFHCKS